MRVALAAIADDGDLLPFDQIEIGIPIIVDTHANSPALVNLPKLDAISGPRCAVRHADLQVVRQCQPRAPTMWVTSMARRVAILTRTALRISSGTLPMWRQPRLRRSTVLIWSVSTAPSASKPLGRKTFVGQGATLR